MSLITQAQWKLGLGATGIALGVLGLYIVVSRYSSRARTATMQPAPVANQNPKQTPEEAIELIKKTRGNWRPSLAQTFTRPTDTLPVAVDIPRLVTHITLYDKTVDAASEGQTFDGAYSVCSLLVALDKALHAHPTPQFEETYKQLVQNGQSSELQQFLDHLTDANTICQMLKGINQAALAPAAAVYLFATHAGFGLPMKDMPGGWKIDLTITKDEVTIIHKKNHIILPQDKILPPFKMEWWLEIVLTRVSETKLEYKEGRAELKRVYDFPEDTDAEKRRTCENRMQLICKL